MTVREFIERWADGTQDDIDVYDNVCEELGIAFCTGIDLTAEGKKQFAEVLDYNIEIVEDPFCPVAVVDVNGPEGVWQKKLRNAKKFFYAAAGYCADEDYQRWFKET